MKTALKNNSWITTIVSVSYTHLGDGLVDLVSNGKVYFNHLEFDGSGNAVPTFCLLYTSRCV